ncbi:ATP-dependent RNA helicase, putative [Entamoeba invadens IP1]|uniref:RNA helicase n=1 Tax=Entamoeba invadens IP1 TaxID=370355 RepID=A0A0A1U6Q0_ENTIV|nr:ATP-dependent RNA helicase, putative [Entamoeba invadens IP1]ELP87501.1 ATP-dependent RNA helicase, putative [Entamoeba invadens IP1]|eukprot:XP_004254272.1 ATP-dependent RNA helicase, putative [Entamoeba invadens IP1]
MGKKSKAAKAKAKAIAKTKEEKAPELTTSVEVKGENKELEVEPPKVEEIKKENETKIEEIDHKVEKEEPAEVDEPLNEAKENAEIKDGQPVILSKTKMTSAKKRRVEKALNKISLKNRRVQLFEELTKYMLTDEELPNLKSSTLLGVETDEENKVVVIIPKKATAVQKKPKVVKKVEEEKVTKIVVEDGKKTFGFGFSTEKVQLEDKPKEPEKPKLGRVVLINTKMESEESSESNDEEEEKMESPSEENSEDTSTHSDQENEENEDVLIKEPKNETMECEEKSEESDGEAHSEKDETNETLQKEKMEEDNLKLDFSDDAYEAESTPKHNQTEDTKSQSVDDAKKVKENKTKLEEVRKNKIVYPVYIPRSKEIKERRNGLPIMMEEANIIEAVIENEVVVICGETGSGKTTQIPQILYEIGFGNENSQFSGLIGVTQPRRIAATAMAERVSEEMGELGNQVSYKIRYDTNVSQDTKIKFMTDGILLKEAQSDVMMTPYSCIIIDEAHERSINTDVLIGLLSRIVKLRNKQNKPLRLIIMSATLRVSEFLDNTNLFKERPKMIHIGSRQYPVVSYFSRTTVIDDYCSEAIKLIVKIHTKLPRGGILVFLTGKREIEDVCTRLNAMQQFQDTLCALPLYSSLDPEKQRKVFQKDPKGRRLCIVSTNVAETSLTIPDIRYVVDSGRAKERLYDVKSGVSSFVIDWISQANAQQRAGRAGRCMAGYCYRMYSSAMYHDTFTQFTEPEVRRMPLESVVLTLKGMGIEKVVNFPFPSQISCEGLKRAVRLLQLIGLLDKKEDITDLGKIVKEYPLHPRLGKLLHLLNKEELGEVALSLVSALSVGDLFIDGHFNRSIFTNKDSDLLSYVTMVDAFRLGNSKKGVTLKEFCQQYGVKQQAFKEILQLREQLCGILKVPNELPKRLTTPEENVKIRKVIANCFVDNVGRLVKKEEMGKFAKLNIRNAYITAVAKEPCVIAQQSFLFGQIPDYVVFHEIIEFNYKSMRGVTRVNYKWLEDVSPDFMKLFEKKTFAE